VVDEVNEVEAMTWRACFIDVFGRQPIDADRDINRKDLDSRRRRPFGSRILESKWTDSTLSTNLVMFILQKIKYHFIFTGDSVTSTQVMILETTFSDQGRYGYVHQTIRACDNVESIDGKSEEPISADTG
jgi:hypothetical protein